MIRFENSLIIKRPVDQVFRFVSDFENLPKWHAFVLEVTKISKGSPGRGTTYSFVRKTDRQEYQIIEYEPNHHVTIQRRPPNSGLEVHFGFEAVGNHTRVTNVWQMAIKLSGPSEYLELNSLQAAIADDLDRIKQLLEVDEGILQPGARYR